MVVYKITNLKNNKIYIGQTIQSFEARMSKHIYDSKNNKAYLISRAIAKYGVENFTFEIIDWATNQTELNYLEWIWIHKENSIRPAGYNLKEGGKNAPINTEHRKKISESNSKRVWTEESKRKIGLANSGPIGYTVTEETKEKLKKNTTKQWQNPEIRKKMYDRMKMKIKEACAVKVVDTTNGKIYDSVTDAEIDNKLKNLQNHLAGKTKTFNKKTFKYLKDWDGVLISEKELYLANRNSQEKYVLHVETGIIYRSAGEASRQLNLSRRSICRVCSNERKTYKNHTFQYINL